MKEIIKKLFLVSRPISWPNTAYPFAVGYLLTVGRVDALFIIGTLFFLIPYNLLMYGINDVFDYESDIRNPRKGGIEGMREQRAFHPTIIRAVLILTIPFIVYLFIAGPLTASLILAAVLFFVVAYSIAKLRFKERPFLDSVTSSIHFVGPLVYALALAPFEPVALPYVIAFFLWGIASHAFGAVQDIIPDRKGKLSSIATVIGAAWTMRLAAAFYAAATIIISVQAWPFALMAIPGILYLINIASYLNLSDKQSMKANAPWRRFIYLNLFAGFVLTMILIFAYVV